MNTDTKTSMYDSCWDKIFPQSDKVKSIISMKKQKNFDEKLLKK